MNILSIDKINNYINASLNSWESLYPKKSTLNKASLSSSLSFLMNRLDDSINLVEDIFVEGKDKKAAVLLIMSYLLDRIILKNLPIHLKPIGWAIRLLAQLIFSVLIDFIVNKYKNGYWKKKGVNNE